MKKHYRDEAIIQGRKKQKRIQDLDIKTLVHIQGMEYEFERISLFDNAFSILLPKTFYLMDERTAKVKYPMESRPQLIYTENKNEINFTFSISKELPGPDGQEQETMDGIKAVIKRMNPTVVFEKEQVLCLDEHENKKVVCMDFVAPALDADVYYYYFIFYIETRGLMLGIFNCPEAGKKEWKIVIPQVVESVNFLRNQVN